MDNAQNSDSYINIPKSQIYRGIVSICLLFRKPEDMKFLLMMKKFMLAEFPV
jgi:hypothetical protein